MWQMQFKKHVMRCLSIYDTCYRRNDCKKASISYLVLHKVCVFCLGFIRYLTNYFSKEGSSSSFTCHDRPTLADQAFAEFWPTRAQALRINNPQELNQKQDGYDVAVVNIQKLWWFRFDRSFGYDLNRQNVYFIDEAHRSYNGGSYLPNLSGSTPRPLHCLLTGTPLITYKKDGKTKWDHAITRDILGTIPTVTTVYRRRLPCAWCEKISRRSVIYNLRSINEESNVATCPWRYLYHPHYVEPMLDFTSKTSPCAWRSLMTRLSRMIVRIRRRPNRRVLLKNVAGLARPTGLRSSRHGDEGDS